MTLSNPTQGQRNCKVDNSQAEAEISQPWKGKDLKSAPPKTGLCPQVTFKESPIEGGQVEEVGDGVEEAGESVGEGEGEDPGEVGEEECEEERDVDEVVEPATKVSPAEIHWRITPDLE